ncbi:MAG: PEP-CTERM sorting domain-containing protein [Methylotenera sp.]
MNKLTILIMKVKTTAIYMLALAALGLSTSVFANISDGSDGAFELSSFLTLPITGSTTFNYTTFSILSGGVLDFSGATVDDNISILATGDVLIDGELNSFPSMLRIETPGSISINGSLNFNNTLFMSAITINIYGVITDAGRSVPLFNQPYAVPIRGKPDSLLEGLRPILLVPEAETYAMLLAGLGLLGFTARRRKAS